MITDIADRLMHENEVARRVVAAAVNRDAQFKVVLGRYDLPLTSCDVHVQGKRSYALNNTKLLDQLAKTGMMRMNFEYINLSKTARSIKILGLEDSEASSKEELRTELKDYLRENFPDENLVHELFHIKAWPHISFNSTYSVSRMRIQQVADAFFYMSAGETDSSNLGETKQVISALRSGRKTVLDSQWKGNRHFMSSKGYQVLALGTTKDHNELNTGDLELYTSFDPRIDPFFNSAVEHYQKEGRILSLNEGEFNKVGLFYSKPVSVIKQILGQSYNLQHVKTPKQ